jgi:hypothetical protein
LQGWQRIADEHPEIDFGVSTPAVNEAWDRLNGQCVSYGEGRNTLADVHRAFKHWEGELVAANQTTAKMFG